MKMQLRTIFFLLFFQLIWGSLHAQNSISPNASRNVVDTAGFEWRSTLCEHDFDSLVYRFLDVMQQGHSVESINDNVIIFRLFNTLDWGPQTPEKDIYLSFENLYNQKYKISVLDRMKKIMMPMTGGGLYFSMEGLKSFSLRAFYLVIFKNFKPIDTTNFSRRIRISEYEFNFQIKKFITLMRKGDSIQSINDYITAIRLFNTVEGGARVQEERSNYKYQEIYGRFSQMFYYQYFNPVRYKLAFVMRHGGEGAYSFKYRIGLGFSEWEPIDQSSFYHINFKSATMDRKIDIQTQNDPDSRMAERDTSKLPYKLSISEKDFNHQIKQFSELMERKDSIKRIEDCLILIRLDNTIRWEQNIHSQNAYYFGASVYRNFDDLFYRRYCRQLIEKLDAVRRPKDASYYSANYDIILNGQDTNLIDTDYYHIVFNK